MSTKIKQFLHDVNATVAMVAGVSAIGAFTYGFDINWWGAMIATPYFNAVYGELEVPLPTGGSYHRLSSTQQSLGAAVSVVGGFIGIVGAPGIARLYGFKPAMAVAALTVIVGSLIMVTSDVGGSSRYWQQIGGKVIVTVGAGMNLVNLPIYLGNCAPSSLRGAMINSYIVVVSLSALIAASSVMALSQRLDKSLWLIPIGIQFVTPALTLATLFLIPENPHWLIERGRVEEATRIFTNLRTDKDPEKIEKEVAAVQHAVEEAKKIPKIALVACFQGTNLKRTMTSIGVMCLFQGQGLGFLLGFLAILFVQLGIANPFRILVIIYAIVLICSCISMVYQDSVGRRGALLVGAAGCAITMLSFAAVLTVYPAPVGGVQTACVALVLLWFIFFTCTWYSVTYTVATEVPSIHYRPATFGIATGCAQIVALIITLATPYLQNPEYANMGPKLGFLYGGFSVFAVVFVYFLVPELKGRALEEIDWMYENGVPIRKMGTCKVPDLTRDKRDVTAEGSLKEKDDVDMVESAGAKL